MQCLVKEEDTKMYIRYEHNYIKQTKAIEEDAWRKIHPNATKESGTREETNFPCVLGIIFQTFYNKYTGL